MTKEITKARIIQEIEDKFKLRDFISSSFLFDETVVPIYDVGQHLRTPIAKWVSKSVTGTGGLVFFDVPKNERWFLNAYNVIFMGAGAFTIAGAYYARFDALSTFMYMDLTAGQTVSYAVNLPKVLQLNPGDKLQINIDGYTSTQDLRMYIDYVMEEIR